MSGEELDSTTVEGVGLVPRGRLMVQFRCGARRRGKGNEGRGEDARLHSRRKRASRKSYEVKCQMKRSVLITSEWIWGGRGADHHRWASFRAKGEVRRKKGIAFC